MCAVRLGWVCWAERGEEEEAEQKRTEAESSRSETESSENSTMDDWMSKKDYSLQDKKWFDTDESGNRVQPFEYSRLRKGTQRGAPYKDLVQEINGNIRTGVDFSWWDTDTVRCGQAVLTYPKEVVPRARFYGKEPWTW